MDVVDTLFFILKMQILSTLHSETSKQMQESRKIIRYFDTHTLFDCRYATFIGKIHGVLILDIVSVLMVNPN